MKKAELQMQETILVIFIVTIIIGIGIFTFYQLQLKSIDNSRIELEQNRDLILLATLKNSPKFSYTYLGNEENAIDTLKLLNSKLANKGFKEITIKQVYPDAQNALCNKQNYPNCNNYVVYSKKPSKITSTYIISTPVSLYFPYTNEYKAGVIEAKSYS
ncbi:MAG: hypothetical protein AABW56_00965 [Nanoarchaeota archaeon]